jgi:hypothetical protein
VQLPREFTDPASHYLFHTSGQELTAQGRLRFREFVELEESLSRAGFVVRRSYGDWDPSPIDEKLRELIIVAERL